MELFRVVCASLSSGFCQTTFWDHIKTDLSSACWENGVGSAAAGMDGDFFFEVAVSPVIAANPICLWFVSQADASAQ